MASLWHLAQMNVGTLTGPKGDPQVQPFFDALDQINALAEASPGFVWRLKDEGSGNATSIAVAADPLFLVNMSVWDSAEALFEYVYKTDHAGVMAKRRQYFQPPQKGQSYMVLWWVPAGTKPTIADGLAKLWHLDRYGPTALAFTFKDRFPAPDQSTPAESLDSEGLCVGWE